MSSFGSLFAVGGVIFVVYMYMTNNLSRFGLPCKPPLCLGQSAQAQPGGATTAPAAAGGGGGGGSIPASGGACNSGAPQCSCSAYVDKGNSPGWYTAGPNGSGHHHCDWNSPCCFCTDPPKCKSSGTPPTKAGSCRPDWGTSGYLGGGPYPKNADWTQCPAGTLPPGNNT